MYACLFCTFPFSYAEKAEKDEEKVKNESGNDTKDTPDASYDKAKWEKREETMMEKSGRKKKREIGKMWDREPLKATKR